MNTVYTIENNLDIGTPYVRTYTVFATDDLEAAKEKFELYKQCCETHTNGDNNEYILYQWDDGNFCKILDRCDDYGI